MRGHGRSDGHDRLRWTSLGEYVSDVARVIDQMENAPILVGHSMGGMIVQKYLEAHQAPAAVMLASAPPQGLIPETLRMAHRHPFIFIKVNLTLTLYHTLGTPELYREACFSDRVSGEDLIAYHQLLQNESYRAYLDMMVLDLPMPERVDTPMLVMGTTDDQLISPDEVKATARAYHTEPVFFSGMGHLMMLDQGWRQVADRIVVWLKERNL